MNRPVWIDTDMGFDDLAAILTIQAAPEIDIAGLSLVAGNAPLDIVADNASRAAALFGWRMPIHTGRDAPLIGALTTASYALGDSAMPTVARTLPHAAAATSGTSMLDAMSPLLESADGGIAVLALGPLTNIAVLLLARPDLAAKIGTIVWMGGSAGPGNHTAAAEFNAFVDPEAVAIVLSSGVPFRMVGLDCCRQVTVSVSDAQSLREIRTARGDLLADLLEGYVRIASADGSRPMALYDPTAAASLLDPTVITFAPARIEVERGGNAGRGATFVEKRVPRRATANAEVAVAVDPHRVREIVLGALARGARA